MSHLTSNQLAFIGQPAAVVETTARMTVKMLKIESKRFDVVKSDVLVVNIFEDETVLPSDLMTIDRVTNGVISDAVRNGDITGALFEVTIFLRPGSLQVGRLLLIGSGTKDRFNFEVASRVAGAAARMIRGTSALEVSFFMRGELSAERKGRHA